MSMDAHFLFFCQELYDRSTGFGVIFFCLAVGTIHGEYSQMKVVTFESMVIEQLPFERV